MRVDRLRSGGLVGLAAAVALFVVLCLDAYEPAVPGGHRTGWASIGWFAALLCALALGAAAVWLVATVTQESPALPLAGQVSTIALGILATIALVARLILQPGLGVGLGNAEVDLLAPAYLAPLLALALTAGAWRATADERTDATSSDPGEIELRPIPPAS